MNHVGKKEIPYYVAVSQDVSWSSKLHVYVKIGGSGLELSPKLARVPLEVTRSEAEQRLMSSMSRFDQLAMGSLE